MSSLDQFKKDIVKLRELSSQSPSFDLITEEQELLDRYRGSLPRGKARQAATLAELYELLVRGEEASSVYTPPELAEELYLKTRDVMAEDAAILDCSSGTGNLAKPFFEAGWKVDLMDMDEMALSLAKLTYPSATIITEDFLEAGRMWDVIIGNPPYKGHKSTTGEETASLKKRFPEVMDNKADLYYAFFAKAFEVLKEDGILSFIVSRYWLEAESAVSLRRFILNRFRILYIHDWYGIRPFGAGVDPLLIVLKKERQAGAADPLHDKIPGGIEELWIRAIEAGREEGRGELAEKEGMHTSAEKSSDYEIPVIREDQGPFIISRSQLSESSMKILTAKEIRLREIIQETSALTLGEAGDFYQGIITGFDGAFIMSEADAERRGIEKELLVPWAKSSDLKQLEEDGCRQGLNQLIYADSSAENCPGFMAYIEEHRERLSGRREVRKGMKGFYELQWGRERAVFESERILFPYKAAGSQFVIAEDIYHSADIYSFRTDLDLKWLVEILNSPLYDRYIKTELKKLGGALYEYYPHRLKGIRIPDPRRFSDPVGYLESIEGRLIR